MTTTPDNRFPIAPFVEALKKLHWGDILTILAVTLSIGAWVLSGIDRNFDKVYSVLERIEADNKSFREIWANESKDFHGRMCTLEEKYHQIEKNN